MEEQEKSLKNRDRESIISIMRALSDARFLIEMHAIEFGDPTQVLTVSAKKLTDEMRAIGQNYF